MEIEFIALEKARSDEVKWLRNLLVDISLWMRPTPSMFIVYDSQAAITKVKSKPKAQYYVTILWEGVSIFGIYEVKVEFGRSYDQTTK